MRAEAVTAHLWGAAEDAPEEQTQAYPEKIHPVVASWTPEKFAQEQICSLVRQVFSPLLKRPVRQVVFTGVEPHADVYGICMGVAATLAKEVSRDVALVGLSNDGPTRIEMGEPDLPNGRQQCSPLRESAIHVRRNLWLLRPNEGNGASSFHAYLGEIRREFEYSVILAPPAGDSNGAAMMAQVADGLVLVLSAGRTRRATACRIRRSLDDAQVRLLGVVLSDREFPIPDRIYRRL